MNLAKKNLIIISIDDLRVDAISSYSKSLDKLKTPTLEKLAAAGTFFNNCVTTAPYTTNAHASILTGLWPYNHGVIDFFRNPLEAPTIFEILKSFGYKTLWQTDFPFLLGEALGFTKGIDKFTEKNEAESLAWLQKNKKDNLACFFHFSNVHEPFGFAETEQDRDDFKGKTEQLLGENNLLPDEKVWRGEHFKVDSATDADLLVRQNYKKVLQKLYVQKKYKKIMELYVAGVNYFDKNRFKTFIYNLNSRGLLKETILVVVGDHGEAWDEHNQGHYKGDCQNSLSEEIIKVPLLFVGPGVKKNKQINKLVRTIDIVPTCLNLLGLKKDYKFDGVDLLSAFSDLPAFSQHWLTDTAQTTVAINQASQKRKLEKIDSRCDLGASVIFKGKENFRICGKKARGKEELKKELEGYNKKTERKINLQCQKIKKINREDIAAQLRAIGYNV